jgi:hypothetical protein
MSQALIIDSKSKKLITHTFDLKGKTLAFSISNAQDIEDYSFNQNDLDKTFLRIARVMLSLGSKLLYGGDLRREGFTEHLFELVYSYSESSEEMNDKIIHLLSWNPYTANPIDVPSRLVKTVRIYPQNINEEKLRSAEQNTNAMESRLLFAQTLSQMRLEAVKHYDYTIMIGGQHQNYKGFLPGLSEEFLCAYEAEKPIFLVGCFGGMAHRIFRYLFLKEEKLLDEIVPTNDLISDKDLKEKREAFSKLLNLPLKDVFRNGLEDTEIERLGKTRNPQELIDYLLKGFYRLKK